MTNIIFLILMILFIQFGMSGGLYEFLVIYPRWKKSATATELAQNLTLSGQTNANRRYWPFISPVQSLLSIVNIVLAMRYTGNAHTTWLIAALIIFINRVITFSYFVPTMISKFKHPEEMDPVRLRRSVHLWTSLSPLRILVEFLAWVIAIWALALLANH
jgi:hypothetical protein